MSEPAPGERSLAEREELYRADVWKNLRRNYSAHLLHGLLGQTGFRLINAPTFIPAYVFALSGSDFVVGLARSLQAFGMFLSPLIGASLIEHRRRVLPVGFVVGGLMRLQVLGIALAGLWLVGELRLVMVVGFLGLFGFFMGMQGVVFSYLMSKVIPVERRGFLVGLRQCLAGLTAAAVAGVGGALVAEGALGDGYAATFLLAFALTVAGLSMLVLVREPEPPVMPAPRGPEERLRGLPALLRSDPAFTRYFIARALATMGRMSVPFYVLYAGDQIALSGTELGQLSMAYLLALTSMNLVWGWVADRTGFRLVFLASLSVWIGAGLGIMQSESLLALLAIFAGLGAGQGGFQLSGQNLVLEFGERQDLPMRIAVANSASEFVGAVGPLLGGLIAAFASYTLVFSLGIAFQVAAVALVLVWVDEPRSRRL